MSLAFEPYNYSSKELKVREIHYEQRSNRINLIEVNLNATQSQLKKLMPVLTLSTFLIKTLRNMYIFFVTSTRSLFTGDLVSKRKGLVTLASSVKCVV